LRPGTVSLAIDPPFDIGNVGGVFADLAPLLIVGVAEMVYFFVEVGFDFVDAL
jgi:hypothetical protein